MRFLSHVHIHDEDPERDARRVAAKAVELGYTHIAMGCHNWAAPAALMRAIETEYGIGTIRYAELDTTFDYPNRRRPTVQVAAYNLPDYSWWHSLSPFMETARRVRELGGRFVLVHPDNESLFSMVASCLDGCEVFNGIERQHYTYVLQRPEVTPFLGADWHVWDKSEKHPDGGKGDPNIFTELPDNWFGEIAA